jgi:magnesium transporter
MHYKELGMERGINFEELKIWITESDSEAINSLLEDFHPHSIAEATEELEDEDIWSLIKLIKPSQQGDVFSRIPLERQAEILEEKEPSEIAPIAESISPDDRADILQALEIDLRRNILRLMSPEKKEETERLIRYPENTAGAVMSTEFASLKENLTASQALEKIRKEAANKETIYYLYVTDKKGRLVGSVSLRDLIMAEPDQPVSDLLSHEVIYVKADEPRTEAADKIQRYDLLAIPVINGGNRLVGLVTVDDIIDITESEVTDDFHKMAAAVSSPGQNIGEAAISTLYRMRVPWLLFLVFMNIFSGAGIAYFENTIETVIALVFFLPILIASGGNAGAQAATLMIRSLATGDIELKDWLRLLGKEFLVASLIGLTLGIAVSLIGIARADMDIAIVVAITMICIVLMGSLIGMSLPFILARLKLDPATASAPLVTSLVDICGVVIYFSIATWYLADRIG